MRKREAPPPGDRTETAHAAPPQSLLERASEYFDLPGDIVAGLPRVQIVGCRQLLLDHHEGLLSFSEREISVKTGRVVVRMRGDGLTIRAMTARELRVEGLMFSVEFLY